MQTISLLFLTFLAKLALCQQPPITGQATGATFSSVSWASGFTIGNVYNISWTSADTSTDAGGSFSAVLHSGNYSQPIFAGVVVSPYLWTVPQIAPGEYTLQLLDNNVLTDISPVFAITTAAEVAAASTTYPTLSSIMSTTAPVAGTGVGVLASTTTVYWDEPCGCHKTALVPAGATAVASATASAAIAAGGLPGADAADAGTPNNYTVPAMATPTTVPAMATPTTVPYIAGNDAGTMSWNWAGFTIAFLGVAFAS